MGQTATVTVQQIPNLSFKGKVTRTSSSLDAQSRTLLTEVDVENPKGVLLPGMYAMVSFVTDRIDPPFLVPDAALVVRSSGTVLAVLQPLTPDEQQKARAEGIDPATLARVRRVHFQTVEPGRDYGIELEILDGLKVGEEVAVDPSDAVQEGALVQIAAPNSEPREGAMRCWSQAAVLLGASSRAWRSANGFRAELVHSSLRSEAGSSR